jgi:fumarate hydratase class II
MSTTRIESGSFGPIEVPFDALLGVQTVRSPRAPAQGGPIACLGPCGENRPIDV